MPWEELDGMDDMTTKPSAARIIADQFRSESSDATYRIIKGDETVRALTDVGYVIVPKADMQCIVDNLVLALARNDEARKNLDKARAMTTDTES